MKRVSIPSILKALLVIMISTISMELFDRHITLANEFKIKALYILIYNLTLLCTRMHLLWFLLFWFAGYGLWLLL